MRRGIEWLRSDDARPVRRRIAIGVDVVLFGLVIFLLYQRAAPQAMAALGFGSPGDAAPEFVLPTLGSEPVALASLRGNVVLVNFWASWCPPCRVEMPGFDRVYRERKDDGFVIVGIATDVHAETAIRQFVADHNISYPIALGSAQVIRDYGGVNRLPESYLVDREGRIRHRVIGYFAEPALRAAVDRLLRE
ncbi:MAG TPA: TlpA disulfide reductase family protein [Longimicrobiales bacterium]|nr:TlpA disulfide reductase family protein [Longimicrobiales bacterium]